MKVSYICAVLSLIVAVTAQSDYRTKCLLESKTTAEAVKKYFQNGLNDAVITDPVNCHIKCVLQLFNKFKDGKINEQLLVGYFGKKPELLVYKDDIAKALSACKDNKGANDCETIYKILMCLKPHKSSDIFIRELAKSV